MLNTMKNMRLHVADPSVINNQLIDEQTLLTQSLKSETQTIYTKIEQSAFNQAIKQEALALPLYINQLEVYLPVYRAIERHCKKNEQLRLIWHESMMKTSLLENDLSCLQTEMLNARVQRMTMDFMQFVNQKAQQNYLQTLGILYALEKLSLIHCRLLPHIQAMYGLKNKGIQFYCSHDGDVYQQWYMFKQRLDSADISTLSRSEVIAGATQTFERVDNLMSNLWKLKNLFS